MPSHGMREGETQTLAHLSNYLFFAFVEACLKFLLARGFVAHPLNDGSQCHVVRKVTEDSPERAGLAGVIRVDGSF